MDLSSLSMIFKLVIIAIIYIIIFIALRIMYNDMKGGGRARTSQARTYGLEILNPGSSENLRKGAVIPVKGILTIGRKSDNMLVLEDPYASSYHAKLFFKGDECVLEDLESTNGTMLNGDKLSGKAFLASGDEISIGSVSFRFI